MPVPLRSDFDAVQLRVIARKAKDGPQARRLLALAAVYEGATRIAAAKIGGVTLQIVRDWVMKFNAHGPDGLINKKAPGQLRSSKTSIGRRSPRSSKKVQSQRFTVLCAGGSSISVNGSSKSSASRSLCRRSAENWAFASSRRVHVIMRRPMARSKILKKFPCPSGGHRAGERHRSRQHRNLVCRRGAHRSEEQDHPPLGEARHQALGADRSTHRLDLYLWRRLPKRRKGRSARFAGL
jgi:hypothetical protein